MQAKADDLLHRLGSSARMASIWAMICSSLEVAHGDGVGRHSAAQVPQPAHAASTNTGRRFSFLFGSVMAWYGQTRGAEPAVVAEQSRCQHTAVIASIRTSPAASRFPGPRRRGARLGHAVLDVLRRLDAARRSRPRASEHRPA